MNYVSSYKRLCGLRIQNFDSKRQFLQHFLKVPLLVSKNRISQKVANFNLKSRVLLFSGPVKVSMGSTNGMFVYLSVSVSLWALILAGIGKESSYILKLRSTILHFRDYLVFSFIVSNLILFLIGTSFFFSF